MKNFEVVVRYEGEVIYNLNAKTEKEAKEKAEKMFCGGDDSEVTVQSEIHNVCDCYEFKDFDAQDLMRLKESIENRKSHFSNTKVCSLGN